MSILVLIVGLWFIGIGAYSFYYAYATKKDGENIKAGWIVGKNIQLKNCKDTKGFIKAIYNKTVVFAAIDIIGGIGIIVGQYAAGAGSVVQAFFMLVLVISYLYYSSAVKSAQKTYLSPSFKAKAKKHL